MPRVEGFFQNVFFFHRWQSVKDEPVYVKSSHQQDVHVLHLAVHFLVAAPFYPDKILYLV
jgi:hypothetical protein